jgi:hypothetical protein
MRIGNRYDICMTSGVLGVVRRLYTRHGRLGSFARSCSLNLDVITSLHLCLSSCTRLTSRSARNAGKYLLSHMHERCYLTSDSGILISGCIKWQYSFSVDGCFSQRAKRSTRSRGGGNWLGADFFPPEVPRDEGPFFTFTRFQSLSLLVYLRQSHQSVSLRRCNRHE